MPSISSSSLHHDGKGPPLLSSAMNLDHEQVYKTIALARKRRILAIVSLAGLTPPTYISLTPLCEY